MTQPSATKKNKPSARSARPRPRLPIVPIVVIGNLIALAAIVIYAAYEAGRPPQPIEGIAQYPGLKQGHVEGVVSYPQTPPAGGPHNPAWQNCGVYSQPLGNENAVHSLEHGAIWITYQPDLSVDEIRKLQSLTRQSNYRLLSPYDGLTAPIVASAWGVQLRLDRADDPRLQQFIEKYEQQGPERGAPCYSGIGQPG